MITLKSGNLLKSDAEALVNTVNCEGFMGKGIALQFKKAYPENNREYVQACRRGEVRPGTMLVHATGLMMNPRYIINFPTKRKWRQNSKIEDIELGLVALIAEVKRLGISSIAVPPLGCGLGGLNWEEVRPKIEAAFEEVPEVRVALFEPTGTPEARAMPIGTARPGLTIPRALVLALMNRYSALAYRLTLLEMQKMAYFLQVAGQPMRLQYVQHLYGPYAHNLNHLLETLEGHYIQGYGDSQKPDVEVALLPNAAEEAEAFLKSDELAMRRLTRVAELIEGFETPYGMELLASVHWVAGRDEQPARSPKEAVTALHDWNERKRKVFKPEHIELAWEHLQEHGWIDERPEGYIARTR